MSNKEFQGTEKIDPVTRADLNFINDNDIDYDYDDSYCQTKKNLLLDEVAAMKHNVRKLRIKIDSESDYGEEDEKEFPVPNSDHVEFPGGIKTIISKRIPSY